MNFSEKYRPPQAPSGKADGSEPEDKWPADFPDYCKGVEFYPDEPFMSLSDGLAKALPPYASAEDSGDLEDLSDNSTLEASLYWLNKSEDFYASNATLLEKLSVLKPLVEKLKEQAVAKQIEGMKVLVKRIRDAIGSLSEAFQLETGTLLTSSIKPLLPLMSKGLNPEILEIMQKRQPKEKVSALLKLLSDNKSGQLDADGLKAEVETLFAEELK